MRYAPRSSGHARRFFGAGGGGASVPGLYRVDFSELVAGTLTVNDGWFVVGDGSGTAIWQVVEDAGSLDGKYITGGGSEAPNAFALWDGCPEESDGGDILTRIRIDASNAEGQGGVGLKGNYDASQYDYMCGPAIRLENDTVHGGVRYQGSSYGSLSGINNPYATPFAVETWYWLRYNYVHSTGLHSVKIWEDGDPEPESFQGGPSNTLVLDGPGKPTLHSGYFRYGPADWDYLSFSVDPANPAPSPGEAATDL